MSDIVRYVGGEQVDALAKTLANIELAQSQERAETMQTLFCSLNTTYQGLLRAQEDNQRLQRERAIVLHQIEQQNVCGERELAAIHSNIRSLIARIDTLKSRVHYLECAPKRKEVREEVRKVIKLLQEWEGHTHSFSYQHTTYPVGYGGTGAPTNTMRTIKVGPPETNDHLSHFEQHPGQKTKVIEWFPRNINPKDYEIPQ